MKITKNIYIILITTLYLVKIIEMTSQNTDSYNDDYKLWGKKKNHYSNHYYNNSDIIKYIKENINITKLIDKYDSSELNSVELSANTVFNQLYIENCTKIDCDCCEGSIYSTYCLDIKNCQDIKKNMTGRIIAICLGVYFLVLIMFSSALAVVFYYLSNKIKSRYIAKNNAKYVLCLVLSVGTVIPGLILFFYKYCCGNNITKCFKADFNGLFDKYVISVDVREDLDFSRRSSKSISNNYIYKSSNKTSNYNTNRPFNSNIDKGDFNIDNDGNKDITNNCQFTSVFNTNNMTSNIIGSSIHEIKNDKIDKET